MIQAEFMEAKMAGRKAYIRRSSVVALSDGTPRNDGSPITCVFTSGDNVPFLVEGAVDDTFRRLLEGK